MRCTAGTFSSYKRLNNFQTTEGSGESVVRVQSVANESSRVRTPKSLYRFPTRLRSDDLRINRPIYRIPVPFTQCTYFEPRCKFVGPLWGSSTKNQTRLSSPFYQRKRTNAGNDKYSPFGRRFEIIFYCNFWESSNFRVVVCDWNKLGCLSVKCG